MVWLPQDWFCVGPHINFYVCSAWFPPPCVFLSFPKRATLFCRYSFLLMTLLRFAVFSRFYSLVFFFPCGVCGLMSLRSSTFYEVWFAFPAPVPENDFLLVPSSDVVPFCFCLTASLFFLGCSFNLFLGQRCGVVFLPGMICFLRLNSRRFFPPHRQSIFTSWTFHFSLRDYQMGFTYFPSSKAFCPPPRNFFSEFFVFDCARF